MWGFGAHWQRARFLMGSRRPKLSSFEVGESESKKENFNILTFYQVNKPVCNEGIFLAE